MNTVILSIGTNVGELEKNLCNAIDLLSEKCHIIKRSSFIVTEPMEYTDQPDFLNGALYVKTSLKPYDLLDFVKNIEARVGRKKNFRYGPRKIDIDIIFYNNEIIHSDTLIIPHEKAHLRSFVLEPTAEIAPDLIHPLLKRSVKQLLQEIV